MSQDKLGLDGTPPPRAGQAVRPSSLRWLLGCLAFLGVSAVFGGIVLTLNPTGSWLQLPRSILQFSPFRDFLIPGLILGIVFGIGSFATLLLPVIISVAGLALLALLGQPLPPFPRTKGNLWLVVLLHTAVNNSAGFWLPVTAGVYAAMVIMMVTLIITDRMWRVRPPERVLARADEQLEPVARS